MHTRTGRQWRARRSKCAVIVIFFGEEKPINCNKRMFEKKVNFFRRRRTSITQRLSRSEDDNQLMENIKLYIKQDARRTASAYGNRRASTV
jgi:hypothetical protein